MERALEVFEQLRHVVIIHSGWQAERARVDDVGLPRRPLTGNLHSLAQEVIHGGFEGHAGFLCLPLQESGDVVINGESRSQIMMLPGET